jgi:hypothetical protein
MSIDNITNDSYSLIDDDNDNYSIYSFESFLSKTTNSSSIQLDFDELSFTSLENDIYNELQYFNQLNSILQEKEKYIKIFNDNKYNPILNYIFEQKLKKFEKKYLKNTF